MARNEYGENFLELGFDWYIVVSLDPRSPLLFQNNPAKGTLELRN
jgi:hypothetical protein